MDFTINCPKCSSPKVRMHNPESLSEQPYESPYVFDAVATTRAICDECEHMCSVEGNISWQQPKMLPKPKDVKYVITFELDADADQKWRSRITKAELSQLKMDIDSESVTIYYPQEFQDNIPIVYWHLDEVMEDANVAVSIWNAVDLYHRNRVELVTKLGFTITD